MPVGAGRAGGGAPKITGQGKKQDVAEVNRSGYRGTRMLRMRGCRASLPAPALPRGEHRGSWKIRRGFKTLGRSSLTEPGLPVFHQPLKTPCWSGRSPAASRNKGRHGEPGRTRPQSPQHRPKVPF